MAYEEKISSFDNLANEIRILDADAGIRLDAAYSGSECFVFVTRSGGGYAVAVYTKAEEAGIRVPGKRLLFRHFADQAPLLDFVRSVAKPPLNSYKY
ncbi:MAG: hypothetical protein JRN39_00190 [Nitrososphaerota archaeon]|nr:hypothetical protein [Nitrososphaerota archaeon]MDG6938815.1 hypothetical protein [Nitrososphaerota archaeon]